MSRRTRVPTCIYRRVCVSESSAAVEEGEERLSGNVPQSAGGERRTSDTAEPREEILSRQRARNCQRVTERRASLRQQQKERLYIDGEFKIELDALRSHSNRGMHVFNNCGAVNSRGLLLSRQKRGPSSTTAGQSTAEVCFSLSRQKKERPVFSKCGSAAEDC